MSEYGEPSRSPWKIIIAIVAILYAAGTTYLLVDSRSRVEKLEKQQADLSTAQKEASTKLRTELKESTEALGQKVGMTREELARRTAELRRQQQEAASEISETKEQASKTQQEVAGVKTDLGGARTDITQTKTDLEATKAKLEKTIGDLGVTSGLVAKNQGELEFLKHRGDRNYYEFTLNKKKRTPISTVSLELKKTDNKKGKFTLNVIADDRTIEKKDRTVNEPLQFYTGRDRLLYELVVFKVDKETVTGYLSTPKSQQQQ